MGLFDGDIGKFLGEAGPLVGAGAGFALGGPAGVAPGAAIGGMFSGAYGQAQANQTNLDIARQTNEMNQANAREQMQFQERMSNTQYQRAVADAKAAGFNPIAMMASPAGTPSGAAGTASAARVDNVNAAFAANAADIMKLGMAMQQNNASIDLMNAQAAKARMDAKVASKDIPKAELTNELYGVAKPLLKKAKSAIQTGVRNWSDFGRNVKGFSGRDLMRGIQYSFPESIDQGGFSAGWENNR